MKLRILFLIGLSLLLLSSCSAPSNSEADGSENSSGQQQPDVSTQTDTPSMTVSSFLDLLTSHEYESTQSLLTHRYEYDEDLYLHGDLFDQYISLCEYEIVEEEVTGDQATVTVRTNRPNTLDLAGSYRKSASLYDASDPVKQADYLRQRFAEAEFEMDDSEFTVNLALDDEGRWIINHDKKLAYLISASATYDMALDGGVSREDCLRYIEESVELVSCDLSVGDSEYDHRLTGIEVRNNGEYDLNKIVVRVEFLDAANTVIADKHVDLIGYRNPNLKAGYSWTSGDRDIIRFRGPTPTEWSDVRIQVIHVGFDLSDAGLHAAEKTAEELYIEESLELVSGRVSIQQGYSYTGPGLHEIGFKNHGDRSLKSVSVTVYFLDEDDRYCAEYTVMVMGSFQNPHILEPNYSWQMDSGRFYSIDHLTDDVDISRYEIKITDIAFV